MFSDAVINFFINSKEAERSLDKLTKKFENAGDSMANSLLSKLGAITAGALGIKGLTEVYNEMKQIIHLAELWNMPIEKLHQFVNMFQLFGGTVDDAVSSVDRLQNLQKALINESSGELKELSARLGVNLAGQDYLGAIELIRSRFNALTDYGQKMVLDALGGDENNALIRMLRAGPNEFMGKWNEAGSFTLLTEQTKRDFIEIEQNIGKIQVALNSIGLEMLQGLAPAIKGSLCVLGGKDADIAEIMAKFKTVGAGVNGDTDISYYDEVAKFTYNYKIRRPTFRPITIKVTYSENSYTPADVEDIIENILTQYIADNPFQIGQVISSVVLSQALDSFNQADLLNLQVANGPNYVDYLQMQIDDVGVLHEIVFEKVS